MTAPASRLDLTATARGLCGGALIALTVITYFPAAATDAAEPTFTLACSSTEPADEVCSSVMPVFGPDPVCHPRCVVMP